MSAVSATNIKYDPYGQPDRKISVFFFDDFPKLGTGLSDWAQLKSYKSLSFDDAQRMMVSSCLKLTLLKKFKT